MGYQQKMLYIASLITVGAAILVGIDKFNSSYQDADIQALTSDLIDIAARVQAHYFTPEFLGGGDHSFTEFTSNAAELEKLFIKSQNINGSFTIMSGNDDFLVLQAVGKNDYDGDGNNLTINMKVYPDSVDTEVVNY